MPCLKSRTLKLIIRAVFQPPSFRYVKSCASWIGKIIYSGILRAFCALWGYFIHIEER